MRYWACKIKPFERGFKKKANQKYCFDFNPDQEVTVLFQP